MWNNGFEKYVSVSYDDRFMFSEILQSHGRSNSFAKTANEFPMEIKQLIETLKPVKDKIFLVIAPMGMGEYWGPNVNGDFFPEKGLRNRGRDYGHETFVHFGNLFPHHRNKDPKRGFGKIIKSVIDEDMGRVVVVASLDVNLAKKNDGGEFLDMLENGEMPDVSMGCKVPYDVCSICGNKAKNPLVYCKHLKPGRMLELDEETGKIAYAINDFPKFFDLSFVHTGADRSSGTLLKIASRQEIPKSRNFYMPSGYEAINFQRKEASDKAMALDCLLDAFEKESKEKDTELYDFLLVSDFLETEVDINTNLLDKIAYENIEDVLGTFFIHGIPLKEKEIQYMELKKMGYDSLAKKMFDKNVVFDIKPSPRENEKVLGYSKTAKQISNLISEDRSLLQPYLVNRANFRRNPGNLQKIAAPQNIKEKLELIYAGLRSLSDVGAKNVVKRTIAKNPAFWIGVIGSHQIAYDLGNSLSPKPIQITDIIDWGATPIKTSSMIKEVFGGPAQMGTVSLLGASIKGFLDEEKDKENKHKNNEDYPDSGEIAKFMNAHPTFATAAFLTVATPIGRTIAKNIIEKVSFEEKIKKSDTVNITNLLPDEEKNNFEYLNRLTLEILNNS